MNLNQNGNEEIEDSDYDPFASVRPKGVTVDDNPSDEASGEDLDEFAAVRAKQDTPKQKQEKPEPKKKPTRAEENKDYAKQVVKNTLIGLGGTWGDLAELAGVDVSQPERTRAKHYDEFDALERMQQPGYKPSLADVSALGAEDDVIPQHTGLPNSKQLEKLNKAIGGPGEPETEAGRYGARQGKFQGAGMAFGQVNPIPAFLGGAAGQAIEEHGGGPLLQMAGEVASILLTHNAGGGKTLVGAPKKEVEDLIQKMRGLGYTEEDITLAINRMSQGNVLGFKAKKGTQSEQAFEDFAEHSDDIVKSILEGEIPGYGKGIDAVHQAASDVYGQMARNGSSLVVKDSTPFINSATEVVRDLKKTLGPNPEAAPFLTRIYDAVVASTKSPTAENMMGFYRELNKLGKWMDRSLKDRLLTKMKNGIKDTFRSEGKAGQKLANEFEKANLGIQKAYKAEELHGLLEKVTTQDGYDYKKMSKIFDSSDNVKLFEEVLGSTQAKNIQTIAKVGKEVKNFDKAWKATNLLKGNTFADVARGAGASYYIYKGDMEGLAAVLATKGMGVAASLVAEKLLTDPKMQNLVIRGLHAIKSESPKAFRSINDKMKEYLDEEGIPLD